MRLKGLSSDNAKQSYNDTQKKSLNTIISRINKIGEFFENVARFEQFVLDDIKDKYWELINVRQKKNQIINNEGNKEYINNYFLPAVNNLNEKIEKTIQNWNLIERHYTTGIIYGFISGIKNLHKQLGILIENEESEIVESVQDIVNNFAEFRVYKAVMSTDVLKRIETLLSIENDVILLKNNQNLPKKRLTIDDL